MIGIFAKLGTKQELKMRRLHVGLDIIAQVEDDGSPHTVLGGEWSHKCFWGQVTTSKLLRLERVRSRDVKCLLPRVWRFERH